MDKAAALRTPDYYLVKAIQWRVRARREAVKEDLTWMVAKGYEALAKSRETLARGASLVRSAPSEERF